MGVPQGRGGRDSVSTFLETQMSGRDFATARAQLS